MHPICKLLVAPICTTAELAACVLTAMGVVSLIIGLFVMPMLELTEAQFYFGLLSLVAFMVVCFCAGQLVLIQTRLTGRCS